MSFSEDKDRTIQEHINDDTRMSYKYVFSMNDKNSRIWHGIVTISQQNGKYQAI